MLFPACSLVFGRFCHRVYASSSSGNLARPAILLLEEYGALGVAITSALKKFAPAHTTHTAKSLKEAEALAGKVEPELFLIDVDPPWPKLTQLLGKIGSKFRNHVF